MCRSPTLAALAEVCETDHLPDLVHTGVKGLKARFKLHLSNFQESPFCEVPGGEDDYQM